MTYYIAGLILSGFPEESLITQSPSENKVTPCPRQGAEMIVVDYMFAMVEDCFRINSILRVVHHTPGFISENFDPNTHIVKKKN